MFLFSFIIAHPLRSHFVSWLFQATCPLAHLYTEVWSAQFRWQVERPQRNMAKSLKTPSERRMSRSIETQLAVAASHLYDTYMDSITDLTPEQLQTITPDSYTSELIREMKGLVGHSVPKASVDIECQNLSQYLYNAAKDNLLCDVSKPSVRSRISKVFATPINAIKDRLQRSSRRTLLTKSVSESSLDELLSSSSAHHVPSSRTIWEGTSISDNTLAQVPSQLNCLLEEPDDDIDLQKDSQITVDSPHRSKTAVKPRGSRASTKSVSSKRHSMSASARKRPRRACRINTSKCDVTIDVVHDECDVVVHTVPETQLSDETADNELTCGARQKNWTSWKLKKNKNKQHTVDKSKDACCLQNGCSHNRTENADMLQCSHCGMWHHFDCVGLISSDAVGVWPCPRCRQQTSLLNTCHTMLTDINTKMTVLSHLQEGMQKQLSKLENIKTLEQSNLDLVRLLAVKNCRMWNPVAETWNQQIITSHADCRSSHHTN